MKTLRGDITLDASALIEYLMGTELGRILKEYFETLKAGEKVYCSLYTISEIFYVICRLKGLKFAMLNSRMIEVNNTERMALEAGRLKCERAISLGDCSCIATAKITRSKAVFARREKELKKEMKKRPFNVEIIFLTEATN